MKIRNHFEKLKEANNVYKKVSIDKQIEIVIAFDWIFKELEDLGVDRIFSEALLMWGKEFVDTLTISKEHVNTSPIQVRQTPGGSLFNQTFVPQKEYGFEMKFEDLTEREKRERALAAKYNALIWRSLPAKDGKVKIEVITKKLPIDK